MPSSELTSSWKQKTHFFEGPQKSLKNTEKKKTETSAHTAQYAVIGKMRSTCWSEKMLPNTATPITRLTGVCRPPQTWQALPQA